MAYIRKIKASLVKQDSSIYTGEDTYLFFDIDKNCLRVSDGVTPGGHPACIEWTGIGNKPSPTITLQGDALGSVTLPELQDGILVVEIPELDAKVDWSVVGQPNGVASLGPDGIVPITQLPESLDNELSFLPLTSFIYPGDPSKLYITVDTDEIYRWDGTEYVHVGGNPQGVILEHSDPIVIDPTLTETVFSFSVTGNTTNKFIVQATDTVDGRFMSSEVICSINVTNGVVSHNQYSITGDIIKLKIDVSLSGTDVILSIQNNDTNSVIASITKIPTIFI